VDTSGNVYIADSSNNRVRKVSGGTITTLAGSGVAGYSGDGGSAVGAQLEYPNAVAVDSAGNVYIVDAGNGRIRTVSPGGTITTVAGGGASLGDGGAATSAQLFNPEGVAVDASGYIYIADTLNQRIRRVSPGGIITTFAGTGTSGYAGDGGPATSAQVSYPTGVAVDAAGNVYVADSGNERIRKVTTNGNISTIAGNGSYGYSGDGGPATSAELEYPTSVSVDALGNLFIMDSLRVRMVSTSGIITTIAGNGKQGYFGDGGPATNAELNFPSGTALDSAGNIYVADTSNNAIRLLSPQLTYLVGDAYPFTADTAGNFGQGSLNTLSLITTLRAVTNLPGFLPATCSDRFDAMDSYPVDTATTRGGDGLLNTLDLIETLRRVTNIDTSRPTRTPRGLTCSTGASVQSRAAASVPEGGLLFGTPVANGGGGWRVPILLRANADLDLQGFSFSAGYDSVSPGTQLNFVAVGQQPGIVDHGVAGAIAIAWLEGWHAKAGQVVVGYLDTSISVNSLRLYGVSANAVNGGREVSISLPQQYRKP
jgi:sugar lactone lactonase YvrE